MHRFHIRDQDILDAFQEREKNNNWDEGEDRDDKDFLELEKEVWEKLYPEQARAENEVEQNDEGAFELGLESENECWDHMEEY